MPTGKPNTATLFYILFAVGGIVIGILIGLAALKYLPNQTSDSSLLTKPVQTTSENPALTHQSGATSGKVLNIDSSSITLQSGNNTNTYPLNQPIKIFKPSTTANPGPPTEDINTVKLNEFVNLILEKQNGEYRVMSINLLPPVGSPPPIPSNFPLSSPPPAR